MVFWKKNGIVAALLELSLLLAIGSVQWFHACGPTEDGAWMSCHWAQQAAAALGWLLFVLSLVAFAAPVRLGLRKGIYAAQLGIALLTALFPGTIIPLCMMDTMRCHTIMQPAVRILAVLVAICAGAGLWGERIKETS